MKLFTVRVHTRENGAAEISVVAHDEFQARNRAAKQFERIGKIAGASAYQTEVVWTTSISSNKKSARRR